MEEPRQLKRYLGCEHEFTQLLVKGHFDPRLAWTVGNPPDKEQPDLRFGPEGLLSKHSQAGDYHKVHQVQRE